MKFGFDLIYFLVGFEYHQAWNRAADLAEAYQIGKLESKAAFALLNNIDEKTVGQLMDLAQQLGCEKPFPWKFLL